jgi:hypothetical protein
MTGNPSCAVQGAVFRKSSYSGQNAQCVEVARTGDAFGLRDSKNPIGPVLAVAIGQGCALLTAVTREQISKP